MIRELTVYGVYAENCYFFIDDTTNSGFLIDPGAQSDEIFDVVIKNRWHIEKILLTHGHFDHFGAAAMLSERLHAPIYIYPDDALYLGDTHLNLSGNTPYPIKIHHYDELYDGEIIRLKNNSGFFLKVIHTPGHTPGSVIFYAPKEKVAFIGDTPYEHGPGLTNFPGGNRHELKDSIVRKILTLPDDTILLSGHSSPISVGEEKLLLLNYLFHIHNICHIDRSVNPYN